MITCVITYEIDPTRRDLFEQYARNWGKCSPRCGAQLIGYFAPHEGSTTLAYGIYSIPSLAEYEAFRARLAEDPIGRENYAFAMREGFIRRESRVFVKMASEPHGEPL
jgi:NIPSNAP